MRNLKLAVIVCCLSLAGSVLAIQPRKGEAKEYFPEQSQEQLSQQQGHTGSEGTQGTYIPDERNLDPLPDKNQAGTESALDVAEQRVHGDQALQEADKRVNVKPWSAWSFLIWALLIAAFGFGAVVGVRKWAAHSIPMPPQ